MDVNVPHALFEDDQLTFADIRVWETIRLDRKNKTILNVYSPERLSQRTGLNRGTIYHSIERLTAAGWYEEKYGKPNAILKHGIDRRRWVNMPGELVISKDLKPRDVFVYGLLKEDKNHRELDGQFTYRILGNCGKICVQTARLAVKALEKAGWLNTHQKRKSQMAPINFALDSPSAKYCREVIAQTKMRLQRPGGHGESLALAMIELVGEGIECCQGARMNTLRNPDTGEMMEVDIWVPKFNLAIEFNGPQHYHPTSFASAEVVAKQKGRDTTKIAMLKEMKRNVLILTAADLSVEVIAEKLKGLVPLRDLRLYKRLVDYLNYVGKCYQRKAQQAVAI